jgi:DNA-binding XRE family transcriptional regulator
MVGKNIATILHDQRRTQAWLAQQCGVTKGHINQIISGKTNPSLKLLFKISDVLSVNINEIVDNNLK